MATFSRYSRRDPVPLSGEIKRVDSVRLLVDWLKRFDVSHQGILLVTVEAFGSIKLDDIYSV